MYSFCLRAGSGALAWLATFGSLLLLAFSTAAQTGKPATATLRGTITDSVSGRPLPGMSVQLVGSSNGTSADALGVFRISRLPAGTYTLRASALGYRARTTTVTLAAGETKTIDFAVAAVALQLAEVTVAQPRDLNQSVSAIAGIDRQLRPVNSAQDLLRLVPGLFIAQHAGGGKAEQIFLRGFDSDHGTDFAVSLDGVPVNMVSHAHGQGYADFHFVIPETIEQLRVYKGPYTARFGDFATSGAGEFTTKTSLEQSQAKVEVGRFDTRRALLMVDLTGKNGHLFGHKRPESAYVASEYMFTNSYFESPQHFKRFNGLAKYTGQLSDRATLALTGSHFTSAWDASGQIPERAVHGGLITRFGSLDNTEGGSTDRTNANAQLTVDLPHNAVLTQQVYYARYHFNLYSNFTFFLADSVQGDQIRQNEARNLLGYRGTYERDIALGRRTLRTTSGLGTRLDDVTLALSRAYRRTVRDTLVSGRVQEQSVFAWFDATLPVADRFTVNAALRADYFHFRFREDRYDSLSGRAGKPRVSPKLNLYYQLTPAVQLFARSGFGFHSNDARSVVMGAGKALPRAIGYEVGSNFKPLPSLVVNVAVWALHLQDELVYVGDEAVVESAGRTRRFGVDLGLRHQLSSSLFADVDLNLNHGRAVGAPKGQNYIPLAPSFTSIGGLTVKRPGGLSASLRYRHLDSRPANEDNTVRARGYFIMDAVASYTQRRYQVGFSIENLLNADWNEAQFDTESRLQGEKESVSELHYTPGTPFFVKLNGSLFF
ncbi:TonB-dependent receptor [Hymenobacter busanensis]|uniref:TonB-dependent receptor n=1 Tax=Hymenobacter busanensis TaxID=2607656 RepID=A0A7L5A499_9BACT|nr:TonB-dependent receptor [Hymenobacter busanensis]KAA9338630.1 TonB-dependent receptor [Hymenobacter busanensis]QHJ08940.1 TonB-dependent receptor plug domain-containing protein [Hymenobacter busanensis]